VADVEKVPEKLAQRKSRFQQERLKARVGR
jgi:hypothetical protein